MLNGLTPYFVIFIKGVFFFFFFWESVSNYGGSDSVCVWFCVMLGLVELIVEF